MKRILARLTAGSVNRYTATALTASMLGLLAALPAAPAGASTTPRRSSQIASPNAISTYELSKVLTTAQLEELLAGLPISELGSGAISPETLSKALASLPALEGIEGVKSEELQKALQKALEGLSSGTTLKEALENPTGLTSTTVSTLESLLGGLLGGSEATELTKELEEALSKVGASELITKLLGSSESPTATLEQLLSLLPTSLVQGVLGGELGELPFSQKTLEELASELGMTTETLDKEVGSTTEQLPGTTEAVLAPLSSGETVAILNGAEKLVVSTLSTLAPAGGSTEGGSGEGGSGSGEGTGEGSGSGEGGAGSGSGGTVSGGTTSGGTGGSPAGGTASTTGPTVIVNLPTSQTSGSANAAQKKHRPGGHIKILRHHVYHTTARLLLKVPDAGKIVVRNKHVRTIRRHVGHGRRLSLLVVLSKAGVASVRHHRRHGLRFRLKVVFKPKHGARSHAAVRLRFR